MWLACVCESCVAKAHTAVERQILTRWWSGPNAPSWPCALQTVMCLCAVVCTDLPVFVWSPTMVDSVLLIWLERRLFSRPAHIDSTFRLSVPLQAGDAFGDRRLLLLLMAIVRAARCFCARAALDERGYSYLAALPAAEPAAEPSPGCSSVAVEPAPPVSSRAANEP